MQPSSITLKYRVGQNGMIHRDEFLDFVMATETDASVVEEIFEDLVGFPTSST